MADKIEEWVDEYLLKTGIVEVADVGELVKAIRDFEKSIREGRE